MRRSGLFIALVALIFVASAAGHALQYPGQFLNPEGSIFVNETTRLHFTLLNYNQKFITDDQLIQQHARKMHVVIISESFNLFWHIHPEDYGDIHQMSLNGSYFVEATFPYAGNYLMAADFVYANSGYPQEGTVQLRFSVEGPGTQPQPASMRDTMYPGVNTLKLKSYPLQANDVYPTYVNLDDSILKSTDQGYTVQITIGQPTVVNHNGMSGMSMRDANTPVTDMNICVMFNITVFDQNGLPATMLMPYLAANAHITLVNHQTRTLYHDHGMVPNDPMLAADLYTLCDDHRIMMDSNRGTFGPIMISYFTPYVPGTFDMIIQFKKMGFTFGDLVVAPFQFTVRGPSMPGMNDTMNNTMPGMNDTMTTGMNDTMPPMNETMTTGMTMPPMNETSSTTGMEMNTETNTNTEGSMTGMQMSSTGVPIPPPASTTGTIVQQENNDISSGWNLTICISTIVAMTVALLSI